MPPGFVISTAVFKNMTADLAAAILASFDALNTKKVAVRSSAVAEDGKSAAWAGQLDTKLDVKRKELILAVERCWASADSTRARAYAKQKDLNTGPAAVIVQQMIHGRVSGVAFSIHPVTQADQIVVEAIPGLAEALVSGSATPDSYLIEKKSGEYNYENLLHGRPLLSDKQLITLSGAVSRLEKFFGFPVDVEWTFARGKLFILQSRPITTLG